MKNKFWTLRYIIINMTYFAVFCTVHAFSSVFLLARGFSSTEIGIILALANIASVIIQPIVAGIIDKGGKLTNRNASIISTILMMLGSGVLLLTEKKAAVFIVFAAIYMIQMAYQPLIIAMNFEYSKKGANINFGLARGLGSAGFAICSVIIGKIIPVKGVNVLAITSIGFLTLSLIFIYFFKIPKAETDSLVAESQNEGEAPHNNFFDFAKTYPKFMLLLVATVCFFFAHNAINDFLIQIITPLGGTESEMGTAIFIAAILELPTMACINLLMKKIPCNKLILISGIFFTVKIIMMFLARNMAYVYISNACQICAYALFIPASAYYVSLVLGEADQVKGQAFINAGITLGGVGSGLVLGPILDAKGPSSMLLVAVCVSIVGSVITYFAVRDDKSHTSIKSISQ